MASTTELRLREDKVSIVQQIVKILEPLEPMERLVILKEAEKIIRDQILMAGKRANCIIRKVSSNSRRTGFEISISGGLLGLKDGKYTYKVTVDAEGKRLIYEPSTNTYDAKLHVKAGRGRLSIPKWAYELIGCPPFVAVRVDGDRIIIEPA